MRNLKKVVNAVLVQQKLQLSLSTYEARKNYLKHLVAHGNAIGIEIPCQELYDSYVSRATTPDLRFQIFHAIRLVDAEAGTMAFTPEGKLYNEPKIPVGDSTIEEFCGISFPIPDGLIDTGFLINRAEKEMVCLHLSASTSWQYMQAWRELYTFLYVRGNTTFTRDSLDVFIEDTMRKHQDGDLHEWKRKIRRRSICVLLEVADTGCFEWKLFLSRKVRCPEDTLEELRQQYSAFLHTKNLENKTIALTITLSDVCLKGSKQTMFLNSKN